MRQPVVLEGPGATLEDVAKAHGITPERQAMLHEIAVRVLEREKAREKRKARQAAKGKKTGS